MSTVEVGRLFKGKAQAPDTFLQSVVDLVGLAGTLWLTASVIHLSNVPGRTLFVLLFVAFGVNARLLVGQVRSMQTVLRKPSPWLLAVPIVAALSAILIQAGTRSYYSVRFAAMFVILWACWIALAQALFQWTRSPLRLLLIAPAPFEPILRGIKGVQITSSTSPPASFGDWDLVVLDPARQYASDWLSWLAHADIAGVRAVSAPLVIEGLAQQMPTGMLAGQWAHEVFRPRENYVWLKRLIDSTVLLLAAPILIPILLLVSLAIRLDDGGPVIFRQRRIGIRGKPFWMLKFRTMTSHVGEQPPTFTERGDPRITRVGRLLRRLHMDELPQVWNVAKGEMSIVGPRPEQVDLAREFHAQIPLYEVRHYVRPGLTGWAQVRQGYADSVDATREKLCFDLYYVRRCSLALDGRIIIMTLGALLTGFGTR